jgi:hypothetical protein
MLEPLFDVQMSKKVARCCGAKHISNSECTKRQMYGPLLTVEMWFCVAGARDFAPCQSEQKVKVL